MTPWTRPRMVWTVFATCLLVVLCVMAWVTTHTLRLEEERQQAEANRDLHERLRLALWRMDSAAGGLVFSENARPPSHFADFYAADQLYTKTFQLVQKGEVMAPSPLLSAIPDHARLYFQIDGDGVFTSPQVPTGNSRDLAEQNYTSRELIEAASQLLEQARRLLAAAEARSLARAAPPEDQKPQSAWIANSANSEKNESEFHSRARAATKSEVWSSPPSAKIQTKNRRALEQAASAGVNLSRPNAAEPFKGAWHNGELFLTRRASLDGRESVQVVWLRTGEVEAMLLSELRDLFPGATLVPAPDQAPLGNALTARSMPARMRSLVALPFHLEPGEADPPPGVFWSPVRRALAIAWTSVMAAAAAAGGLVAGIVGLSERRAAFVSAVTHEMRTPLTTFRLYSEMLSTGMVTDPAKESEYLQTLTSEADRLGHLVENVLAYARLEKGRARAQVETLSLQSIIKRVRARLEQRAAQEGLEICVRIAAGAGGVCVRVDITAVEQILFNLVDNACKYGRGGDGANVIDLEADTDGSMAVLRVRDHGQGIRKSGERRLFRPFEKSADEAAHSAPGVGLGLALCRKLSRALGGELRLCGAWSEGACFILTLPALKLNGGVPSDPSISD